MGSLLFRRCRPCVGLYGRIGQRFASPYSTEAQARGSIEGSRDVENFSVTCGSSGVITVDLYNSHALTKKTSPLIVYLPPSGSHLHAQHGDVPSYLLSDRERKYPVACINYRWNYSPPVQMPLQSLDEAPPAPPLLSSSPDFRNHPFPTPLHDVMHAYSWLTETFLKRFTADSSQITTSSSAYKKPLSRATQPLRPLLIYGSHLGGSLATSLALTESRTSISQNQIAGLIVSNSVFDWTGVATKIPPESVSNETPALTLPTLHRLKDHLFAKPSSCFDSFASPVLFFRSPGVSIPPHFPGIAPRGPDPTLEYSGLSLSPDELADLVAITDKEPDDPADQIKVTRKSPLRFPPKDSGLKIPRSLFIVTEDAAKSKKEKEMQKQAAEMVKVMRRSVVTHEFKDRKTDNQDGDPQSMAENRVQMLVLSSSLDEGRVVGDWVEDLDLR